MSNTLCRGPSLFATLEMAPPGLTEVTAETVYRNKQRIPDIGLSSALEYDYRVYALACEGGRVYVGIAHKSWVGRRIAEHSLGEGACFTKKFAPHEILLVYPAACRAVEAYVYYALLAGYASSAVYRVGGWTQTNTMLNPLAAMQAEREHHMLNNKCFNCGGDHYARHCTAEPAGRDYKCGNCQSNVRISNNGSSTTTPMAAPRPTSSSPTRAAVRRLAPHAPAPRKVARTAGSLHVLAFGKQYTSLAWYLGRSQPTPRECALAKASCSERRLELKDGDTKTLQSRSFASVSNPQELLPGRERLLSTWMETSCRSLKEDVAVKLCKPGGVASTCRQVLWLLSDLQEVFPNSA